MFRFTIRDVLWLTVVVAMGAGWFIHVRAERQARERETRKLIDQLDPGQEVLQQQVRKIFENLRRELQVEKAFDPPLPTDP
jgi:preprotein translocase subunit YajC